MDFLFKESFKSLKHPMKTDHQEENSALLSDSMSNTNKVNLPESSDKNNGSTQLGPNSTRWSTTENNNTETTTRTKIWRESSYDFQMGQEDPPSKLINQFLHKQKASGDVCLDMDVDMQELNPQQQEEEEEEAQSTPREFHVSFEPSPSSNNNNNNDDSVRRRRYRDSQEIQSSNNDGGGEVVRCTSNLKKSSLMKTKTKSRLMDPPADAFFDRRSGRLGGISGQIKSGFIGRSGDDEDESDSFWDDDIPHDYKGDKVNFWVLLEWLSLFLIIGGLVCTLVIPLLRRKKLWELELWKWEVMVSVMICGRLVSSWVIRIVVIFIERSFLLRKRVLYFVYGLRKPVQNCLWLGLVLLAWHFLFDKRVMSQTHSKVPRYVTRILGCLLLAAILWLLKTLVIKVLASTFHVNTYFDRIQESLFNQYVIETLSGPPLVEIKRAEEEEERIKDEVRKLQSAGATVPADLRADAFLSPKAAGGRVIGSSGLQKSPRRKSSRISRASSKKEDDGITIDHLHKLNPKNVSAWNMKRLMNIIRTGALSTLDEQLQGATQEDENATQIRSENEAKNAAKKIFSNVARPGSKYIYLEDLMRFMPEEEALKTLSLFEGACESSRISKKALKDWVVNAFRERRALALTLDDTKTAVNKLHHFVNGLVCVIIAITSLLILGIATTEFLVYASSQLLLVAFVFGNTCKNIFEAIIFLFVMHPFDVGDRCEIDGVQLVVEEMNILTTVFLRFDNQKITYPNITLATKPIGNFYRSPDMGDAVEFCIHVATPAEKIAAIKQRITSYVENCKDHWYPAPMIIFKDFEELNRVRIAVWLTQRMNFQDMGEKFVRRALLVEEMLKIFKELDIDYRLLPLPINVRSMPPVTSERLPSAWTAMEAPPRP